MPTVFKSNKGYYSTPFRLITNDITIEVTVSNELYAFISNQSEEPVTFETIDQHFKPVIPTIPMVDNLRVLPKARNSYNQNVSRLDKARKLIGAGDELFKPYTGIRQAIEKRRVLEDDTRTDFKGCYWTNLNPENLINHATHYELYKRYTHLAYGVSDNATQVLDNLYHALETYLTKDNTYDFFTRGKRLYKFLTGHPDAVYFIRFTPVFNHHNGAIGGWRWRKWGTYLGKHTPQYEYLDEEENIDYVLLWHLYPLKKKGNSLMTISTEKAQTILDKTLDITTIDLTDEQKNELIAQLSQQSISAKTRDEKIAEVSTLIEIIENYVEKEDINVDNSERMDAVMYEGIPADETSAFYGSWYFAIEDMMLAELY